jgi:para-nitrobenzyl esterase
MLLRTAKCQAVSVSIILLCVGLLTRASAQDAPIVTTSAGPVRGVSQGEVEKFLGIPYAAPPVGELRWQPPKSPARWSEPRAADTFAAHCAQPTSSFSVKGGSEDCLYLNVYRPAGSGDDASRNPWFARRPVMVWIHGGGLVTGASDQYDPTRLVEQGDVIVVTINYRLGYFGFLAHPALTAASKDHISGNYGLLDQQAALDWVRDNIAPFGGDPSQVTIFGESAGGMSVRAHLVATGSRGRFAGAIIESGAYSGGSMALADVEKQGTAFAATAGCSDQSLDCLRKLSTDALVAGTGKTGVVPLAVDGHVLALPLDEAFRTGRFNRVPVVSGSNHDEGRLFVATSFDLAGGPLQADGYKAAIGDALKVDAALVDRIAEAYPLSAYDNPDLALSAVQTDATFSCNALSDAQSLSRYVPTFAYELNDPNVPLSILPKASIPYGSAHSAELPFLFDLAAGETDKGAGFSATEQTLSRTMIQYWTTFARRGDPNGRSAAYWPGFRGSDGEIQSLTPPTPGQAEDFAADHKCDFWTSLAQQPAM